MEIGIRIKELRTRKGITQEELGKPLNVSTQAVSKWENGGLPDLELIPSIANYFNVTTDYLFNVSNNDYKDIEQRVCDYISSLATEEERVYKIYELGYLLSIAMFTKCKVKDYDYKSIMNQISVNYSLCNLPNGFTFTSLNKKLPFFLAFPKPKDSMYNEAIKYKNEQLVFFKEIANEDFYNTLIYINSRVNKSFTSELIVKELGINKDRAEEIIEKLLNYKVLTMTELELNDELIRTYSLNDSPLIVAMLAVVNTVINRPNCFYHYVNNNRGEYFERNNKSND